MQIYNNKKLIQNMEQGIIHCHPCMWPSLSVKATVKSLTYLPLCTDQPTQKIKFQLSCLKCLPYKEKALWPYLLSWKKWPEFECGILLCVSKNSQLCVHVLIYWVCDYLYSRRLVWEWKLAVDLQAYFTGPQHFNAPFWMHSLVDRSVI